MSAPGVGERLLSDRTRVPLIEHTYALTSQGRRRYSVHKAYTRNRHKGCFEVLNLEDFFCVDAFAGAGGLSLGLRDAGFKLLYAFDANETAVQTYNRNLGKHAEARLIEEITAQYINQRLPKGHDRLDLLAGGPPCQGFSKQKRGAHNGDERNRLVVDFAHLIDAVQPRYFLLENVAMLGQKRGRLYTSRVIQHLSEKYRIYAHFYNSADYGLAQTRERFIIVGEDRDLEPRFVIPNPTVKNWLTVGQVLKGLPEPPDDYSEHARSVQYSLG